MANEKFTGAMHKHKPVQIVSENEKECDRLNGMLATLIEHLEGMQGLPIMAAIIKSGSGKNKTLAIHLTTCRGCLEEARHHALGAADVLQDLLALPSKDAEKD